MTERKFDLTKWKINMTAWSLAIASLTLLGLTFLITKSEGKIRIDLIQGTVEIDSKSQSPVPIKGDGCQPGEENNRLCDSQ